MKKETIINPELMISRPAIYVVVRLLAVSIVKQLSCLPS
jgi:hypothetical protein